ncbi:hypothetical protein SMC1_02710 [Candidatus Cryosericum septentrionale]|uniref:Uncharacterized protein n=1 Tax=Candidatus Cryosericum septentrionale TaxID=2290913 RepID=A0A398DYJ4_9BACT|nr:hypothetical protein SMC1_02710 [Candidatus Cryosericum septentrionale]
MDSRLRGNDGEGGEWQLERSLFVVLADAGTHAMMQGWIPGFAEKHPSPWTKGLGGMTESRDYGSK